MTAAAATSREARRARHPLRQQQTAGPRRSACRAYNKYSALLDRRDTAVYDPRSDGRLMRSAPMARARRRRKYVTTATNLIASINIASRLTAK